MSNKTVKCVQFISPYIDAAVMDYDGYIACLKQKMVCDLLETYPSMVYNNITFEIRKLDRSELPTWLNQFKLLDGRYLYHGEVVSREYLEKELADKDYKIIMTATTG